jgi:hypothetical protein
VSSAYGVEQFVPAYQALQRAKIDFVIVGGQACAFWAVIHGLDKDFSHYTTKDFDACARSTQDVTAVANVLKVVPVIPRKASASPDLGSMELPVSSGAPIVIHFLRHCYGVSAAEIFATQQPYYWEKYDLKLSLMHPVLCLQDKAASLCGLHQTGRQDLKHLRMAMRFSCGFITELVTSRMTGPEAEKDALRICQRVLRVASSRAGIQCALKHRIAIEEALPVEALKECKSAKVSRFVSGELPRAIEVLEKARKAAESRSYL